MKSFVKMLILVALKKTLWLSFAAMLLVVAAQAQAGTAGTGCAAGGTSIASGLTTLTYTDSTVADGATYQYLVTANLSGLGGANLFSCSGVVSATIPATGTNTVALSWTASTSSGVTYSVFRAAAPAAPTGLTEVTN